MSFYTESQRAIQADFSSEALADRMELAIVDDSIVHQHHAEFIASRDFFFLSTVNGSGEPTVSYKGGPRGVVRIVDPKTLAFPLYDGNGMFLSAGNVAETAKIGLLFIDFETPNRLRVQATASIAPNDELLASYPGALLIVRATIDQVFVNCARLVHQHTRVASSPYVPNEQGYAPLPAWKRIDGMQDVLRPVDQHRVEEEGGVISAADYAERLAAGES